MLYPLATERIEIDLDDGVKVNYKKFGKALQKVTGVSEEYRVLSSECGQSGSSGCL